ncbi:MAG: hypothetical protein MZV65_52740 [Chromatiales bacterium]|nr:hypothetical protein [Chromatiales bacterium]
MKTDKPWSGRFTEPTDSFVESLHRLGRVRPAPVPGTTSPGRSRTPRCWRTSGRAVAPRTCDAIERGLRQIRGRDRTPATFEWSHRARGRAPEHRARA